jgi:hypothetical protein
VFSDRRKRLYPLTLKQCIPELMSGESEFATTAPRDLILEGSDLTGITKALAAATRPTSE